MKKLKVFLQYPWKYPDSPYYKYLLENPLEGFEYLNTLSIRGTISNYRKFRFLTSLKVFIRKFIKSIKISVPNAWKSKSSLDFDLIHCAHCLSKNENIPWVADIESFWSMFVGNSQSKRGLNSVLNILRRDSCKKILPWSDYTYQEIIKNFPEIKEKVELLYPALPIYFKKEKKENSKIKILYATRHFWLKGGLIALEVLTKIKQKYGNSIEITFISDVPLEIREKYQELEIRNLVDSKKLFKIYQNSDIFFYPSFVDTFGFGLLEAMSFGLPIITIDTNLTNSVREIVNSGKNGLIIDIPEDLTKKVINKKGNLKMDKNIEKIIDVLVANCSTLIEDKKLRKKMSLNALNEIKFGKFSLEKRNKKLKEIYLEAIA